VALPFVTIRPNSTSSIGVVTNTVTGAANAHTAWSDNTDTSYVQLTARCRNDPQVVRVGFPTPTIPAGAKVLSVGLRRRVATVITPAPGVTSPVGLHWFRCLEGSILIYGQSLTPYKAPFSSQCPTDATGGTYLEESLGSLPTAPSGAAWDATTNLATGNFFYDYGRGDDVGGNHRVSEIYIDVVYQQQSVVAVTGPTGSVASTTPTATWTFTSPDNIPQQGYEVALYSAAQVAALGFAPFVSSPLQTSGPQLGEDLQWAIPNAIPDGSYSVYVRSTAKWSGPGDFVTAIASTTFTRAVAAGGGGQPAAAQPPNATLSSAVFDATNDRVAITMVPSSGSPTTAAYDVQVSRDGGVTWDTPPSLTRVTATGMTPLVLYDYLAPISAVSQYRILSYSLSSSKYVAAAATSSTLSVTTTGSTWRLADPANPLLNCVVIPVAGGKDGKANPITYPRMIATFQTLSGGGTEQPPIVRSGPTYGEAGTLTLRFQDAQLANWPLFLQQLQSGHTLLLKKSFAEQKWIRLAAGPNTQDPKLTYDVKPGKASSIYWREITLGYCQCRAPLWY
jgi:hypothetical protein